MKITKTLKKWLKKHFEFCSGRYEDQTTYGFSVSGIGYFDEATGKMYIGHRVFLLECRTHFFELTYYKHAKEFNR